MLKDLLVLVVVTAAGMGSAGCTYAVPAVHVPASIPAVSPDAIDLEEVTVAMGPNGVNGDADPETVAHVRAQALAIFTKAARERGARRGAPSRLRVHVALEQRRDIFDLMQEDGLASMSLPFLVTGTYFEREKLSVDVSLTTKRPDASECTFVGHGVADKAGSIYARAQQRALARAIESALLEASGHCPG